MATCKDLPYLLQLLDDESPVVQDQLVEAFTSVFAELPALSDQLDASQRLAINRLVERERRVKFVGNYFKLLNNLELSLGGLAEFLCGPFESKSLTERLDEMAESYREASQDKPHPLRLAEYLFTELDFQGDQEDYYNPLNSNLIAVLNRRKGNPISLCCLFILVARRLDFEAFCCNYPGHFLTRVDHEGTTHFVDCFARGMVLDENLTPQLSRRLTETSRLAVLYDEPPVAVIMARVLRNIYNAHLRRDEREEANVYQYLLERYQAGDY